MSDTELEVNTTHVICDNLLSPLPVREVVNGLQINIISVDKWTTLAG